MNDSIKEKMEASTKIPRYAWMILGVVFLASLSYPMNYLKPPGIASTLIPFFGIGVDQFGLLMSVFSITGLILALPAGLITQKFGVKRVIIVSVAFCFAGAIVGMFANSFSLLLFSRFLEGLGSLIFVAAPAAIIAWFPDRRQGFALGLWSICMPAGSFIMLNTAPHLTAVFDWQAVWVMGAIVSGVALLLFALLFKMPSELANSKVAKLSAADANVRPSLKDMLLVLKNRDVWLAGFIFGCFNFVVATVIGSYYPYFLETQAQTSNAMAASISSIPELISIIGEPVVGLIADKIGRRKPLLMGGCLILGVAGAMVFTASSAQAAIGLMCIFGICSPFVIAGVRLVVPEVTGSNHLKAGMGNAVLAFFQNLVGLLGPIIAGVIVVNIGWAEIGFYLFVPIFICAFIASMIIKSK